VTGEADFIMIITVRTMDEYEELTRRLFFENRNVKHFRSFVAMQRVKVGLDIRLS
jgi:DNA-binding Lrp family transcriptional regulator